MPVILRPMRPFFRLPFVLVLVALLAAFGPAEGAGRKKKPKKKAATPTPTATATPTPIPYLRAAGACSQYVPGQHIVVAEVGESGRVYRIDKDTVVGVKPRTGTRVRILFFDTPDGPLAKKILPGPVPVTPTPTVASPPAAPPAPTVTPAATPTAVPAPSPSAR